jgi:hypothetical protein
MVTTAATDQPRHGRPDLIATYRKEKPAMTKLTTATRKKIPTSEFALPGRRYPIEDEAHARNALARVSQDGTPGEKATVRRKVHRLFPSLKQERQASTQRPG